jgi:predicted Zn-dependent peptidase
VQGTIEAILSSGMSSRLFQEIREKRALVYSVYGYFRPYVDVGQGVVYAGTDLERVEETISASVEELRKLRDERVPDEELERTKRLRRGAS